MLVKIGKWNCEKSIKVHIGHLWLGGSWDRRETKERCPAVFIIFNGKRKGWQFLSWQQPRWASWSVKVALGLSAEQHLSARLACQSASRAQAEAGAEPVAVTAGQDSRESAGL